MTAQLVEAETGHHLWADRYDWNAADFFEVQDEIVDRVAGAIEPEMLRTETLRAREKTPKPSPLGTPLSRNVALYQVTRDHHQRARETFRKAIEAAPEVAEGHTWLGRCNAGLLFYGWSNDEQADADEGWQAAMRAARLAPADPYSHYAVGMMSIVTNQPKRAMEAAQRSLDRIRASL